jgi:predicted AAA+ superfamily ATPase
MLNQSRRKSGLFGKKSHKNFKMMLLGPRNIGKTSFLKLLTTQFQNYTHSKNMKWQNMSDSSLEKIKLKDDEYEIGELLFSFLCL